LNLCLRTPPANGNGILAMVSTRQPAWTELQRQAVGSIASNLKPDTLLNANIGLCAERS
jgi:hypothetical protein